MPMTVITVRNAPNSLRGDLTKWMQEISTGVYIGNFNSRIRAELWGRVIESVQGGEATLSYYARSENGYEFETYNTDRKRVDYDGIPLVLIPTDTKMTQELKGGFSNASKFHKGRQMAKIHEENVQITLDFIAIDITVMNNMIREISAIKTVNDELTEFMVKIENESNDSSELKLYLTEIVSFVEDLPIVGYDFGLEFQALNTLLSKQGLNLLPNSVIDLVRLVKKENPFLQNYKIMTVMEAFGIENNESQSSLLNARMIIGLANKLNKFRQIISRG
ncbi:type I-E CRISPR-associated endoribonuclease Cas2e [Aerococcus viridans]|uniref:type I-E CRISPR-associated endoribonuclease Cas2e n=1 Tax=Aerococcus viridans TaxID=1377 RepID=UPI002DB72BA3|nr:type I-E CRISPR-associated endoribonuclease Cas2e [Aerococcus viridans]MEC1387074.1 type I-E CRISPR-associated endoribonuclease Cas2e [Aerococcus viridans]